MTPSKDDNSMFCNECSEKVYATIEREIGGIVYALWECCGEKYAQDLGCVNPEKAKKL